MLQIKSWMFHSFWVPPVYWQQMRYDITLSKICFIEVDIENSNIEADINYFQGFHTTTPDLSMLVLISTALFLQICYYRAQAGTLHIAVDIGSSQSTTIYIFSKSLPSILFDISFFPSPYPFFLGYLPILFQLFSINISVADNATERMNNLAAGCVCRCGLVRWVFEKCFHAFELAFVPFLECFGTDILVLPEISWKQWSRMQRSDGVHPVHCCSKDSLMTLKCKSWLQIRCAKISAPRWLYTSVNWATSVLAIWFKGFLRRRTCQSRCWGATPSCNTSWKANRKIRRKECLPRLHWRRSCNFNALDILSQSKTKSRVSANRTSLNGRLVGIVLQLSSFGSKDMAKARGLWTTLQLASLYLPFDNVDGHFFVTVNKRDGFVQWARQSRYWTWGYQFLDLEMWIRRHSTERNQWIVLCNIWLI